MNTSQSLLAAICANPAEDTPRLAYADWLDEFGGEDGALRAEFIRGQILLHGKTVVWKAPKSLWEWTAIGTTAQQPYALWINQERSKVPSLGPGDLIFFHLSEQHAGWYFPIKSVELGGADEPLTTVRFGPHGASNVNSSTIDAWEATSLRERLSAIYREYFPIVINGHRLKESTVRGAFWFRSTVESWPLQLNWIPPEIERGFRKHLACTWETWRTEHEKIRAWQPITEVTLTTRPEWYGYEGNFATSHSSSHSTSWDAFRLKDDEVIITRKQYDEEKRIGDVYYEQTLLRCRYPGVEFKVEAGTGQGGDAIMTGGRPPSLSHFRQAVVNTLRTSIGEDARQILAVVEEVEFITVPELHVDRSRYIRPHLCNPPSARMTEQGPMVNYGQVAMTLHRLHMPPNYPNCTGVYWGRCSGCQRFFVGLREGAP